MCVRAGVADSSGLHAYVPDLLPLKSLTNLSKLHLGTVDLGKAPCLNELTQLNDLAILGCVEAIDKVAHAVGGLLKAGNLQSLQLTHPSTEFLLALPQNRLQTLLQSVQHGLTTNLHQLDKLKVLALVSIPWGPLSDLSRLTGLEALSLAGSSALETLDVKGLAAMSSLR